MKMRNWLKTTLALGLVAATGSVLVGCGCDEKITYKAGIEAYNEAVGANYMPKETSVNAAKDGFTIKYTLKGEVYEGDNKGSSVVEGSIVTYGKDAAAVSRAEQKRTTKTDKTTETKYDVGIAKIGEGDAAVWTVYDTASKKKLTAIGSTAAGFEYAYQTNILFSLEGFAELLDGATALDTTKDDPVADYNEANKATEEGKANNSKKVLKADFFKTGENSYRLTLNVVETAWTAGEGDKVVETVTMNEATFELQDKKITKVSAKYETKKDGKKQNDGSFVAEIKYSADELKAPTIAGDYTGDNKDEIAEFAQSQFQAVAIVIPTGNGE